MIHNTDVITTQYTIHIFLSHMVSKRVSKMACNVAMISNCVFLLSSKNISDTLGGSMVSKGCLAVPILQFLQISAFFLFSNFRKRQIALYSPCRLVGRSVGRLVDVTINFFNI